MASTIDVGEWLSNETARNPSSQKCGLFAANDHQKPLPLRTRAVNAQVYAEHGFCEVQEELAYLADEDCTVRFVFPLPPRSAVFKFKATIGDRQVVTEVKRKAAAQEEYDEAVRQGHTAVHMQQQVGASLYSVEVGNLSAMEEAIISFSYVRLLNSVAGAVEFEHQATWVPPYLKASELDTQGTANSTVAPANPVFAGKVSYKLSYHILVQSSRGFRSIVSPSPVAISEGEDPNVRIVTQDEQVSDPSRDLMLLIELPPLAEDQTHVGQLLVQECVRQGGKKNKTVALATFIPRLPKPAAGHVPQAREIIFVVDGSGSMEGSPIRQALEAALFFVKDLPAAGNVTFNAAMFGSGHRMMWLSSKPYDQAAQADAIQWLQSNVNAKWGGTEVLSVLQLIYDALPLTPGASRQIIFLTDGGVSGQEEEAIHSLVQGRSGGAAARAAAARTSIFSLGIGHGVHRGLVEGVALKTGGLAQFVVDGEPIGRKAGLLKRCALAAEGGCWAKPRLVSRSCIIKAAPNVLPPRLFPDEPLHVLVEVVKAEPGASLDLTASGPGSNGQDSPYSISLALDAAVRVPGDVFAVLHAMSSIGSLLAGTSSQHCASDGSRHPKQPDARQVEDAVVVLAEEEGLVTPYTSGVGVLLQKDPLDPSAVKQVEVPLQLPAGRGMWAEALKNKSLNTAQTQQHGAYAFCMAMAPAAAPSPFTSSSHTLFAQHQMPSGGLGYAATSAPYSFAASQPSAAQYHCAAPTQSTVPYSFAAAQPFGGAAAPPQSVAFGGAPFGGVPQPATPWGAAAPPQSVAFGGVPLGGVPQPATPWGAAAPPQSVAFGGVPFGGVPQPATPWGAAAPPQSVAFGGAPQPAAPWDPTAPRHPAAAFGFSAASAPAPSPLAFCMAGASADGTPLPSAGPVHDLMTQEEPEAALARRADPCARSRCEDAGGDGSDAMEVDVFSDQPLKSQQAKDGMGQLWERKQAGPAASVQLLPSQVLSLLNLRRTVDGAVLCSPEVLQALAAEAFKQQAAALSLAELSASLMTAPARPAALTSDDAWVTLLALAYLRRHLSAEHNVWSGLEAKALEWLSGVWPSDVGRSIGSVVLAAMKLI